MANEKKTLTPEEKQAQDAARIARKQALSMHIRALRRVLIVSASAVLIAFIKKLRSLPLPSQIF